ncbi:MULTISPECIES: hypothetical protein [unclassified Tolypothrix]|nr:MULTISPECIES: hypothetical protein [unclassified Tolypothrix]EKE96443.1 hypothetical protein FDUTEX481_07208 [Tolypothrix sp. PCC 7601]MBE9086189.1 hypothetical protein [Tolypothrix sp. LEGE 11397]UYD30713.1 hypothetical protein HGR01_38430 [Tolypothrix sp. PCC 7712]
MLQHYNLHAADKSGHNVMPKEMTVVEQVLASLGKMTWESYLKIGYLQ